ncbi:Negative elongation factor C/D [Podochytrium sp. JEL0797]|nr:Negative elongation factor C/D [Podochytrium sp. JEL0797]
MSSDWRSMTAAAPSGNEIGSDTLHFVQVLSSQLVRVAAVSNELTVSRNVATLVTPLGLASEASLLVTLALLRRGAKKPFAQRVAHELEAILANKTKPIAAAAAFDGRPPQDLVTAVSKIKEKDVQASNVVKLYNFYCKAEDKPRVHYLRSARFVEALIKNLFGAEQTDNSMIDEKIWLLAYVSSVTEDDDGSNRDTSFLEPTVAALKYVHSVFPKLTPDIDLKHEFVQLRDSVRYPIAAAGLLYWISRYISDPVFYESNSLTSTSVAPEPILIFELLNEIAIVHPLQRTYILEILGEALVREYDRMSPLIALEVRKKFMEEVIYLLKLGFTLPPLQFINDHRKNMDDALLVYFLRRIHEITEPPYDPSVIDLLVFLVSQIDKNSVTVSKDSVVSLLDSFLTGELVEGWPELVEKVRKELAKLNDNA